MMKKLLASGSLITAFAFHSTVFAELPQLNKAKTMQLKPVVKAQAAKPTVPLCNRPRLDAITPYEGATGVTITLTGSCFGSASARHMVSLNHYIDGSRNKQLDIRTWSDSQIRATIPGDVSADSYQVYVHVWNGDQKRSSNNRSFKVIDTAANSRPAPKKGIVAQLKPGVNIKAPATAAPQVAPRRIGSLACTIDPAAYDLRVIHPRKVPDGRVVFHLQAGIKNVGTGAFQSAPNQAMYTLREGNKVLKSGSFTNLRPGQYMDVGTGIENWRTSDEFPPDFKLEITYGPDIRTDGNDNNDDCRMTNNKKTLTGTNVLSVLKTAPSVPN